MKKITLSFYLLIACMTLLAQAPEKFNYQALARDSVGNPLKNRSIAVKFSVLSGTATGTVAYSESHAATTDNLGMFSLAIGTGTVLNGTFADIDWGGDDHFLKVELDPIGGSTYNFLGTSQLLSVPFAVHANELSHTNFEDANVILGKNAGLYNSGTHNVFIGLNAGRKNTAVNNTFVGMGTGFDNTSGNQNVFVGTSAGTKNSAGSSNSFFGFYSGRLNTTGAGNTFLGVRSGTSNTIASHNTLIGNNAGATLSSGPLNTMIGALAGREQTDATENTYVGYFAARNTTSGDKNTVLGSYAGSNANGDRNVFMGYEAGHDDAGSDQLIIANGRDSSNVLIRGNFVTGYTAIRGELATGSGVRFADGTLQTTAAISGDSAVWTIDSLKNIHYTQGKVGIGTSFPDEQLTVAGKIETTEGIKFSDGSIQITAFDKSSYAFPSGGIIMWSGNTPPSGWVLCDGTNGTPDLQGRFIVGFHPGIEDYDQPGNLSGDGTIMGETGGATTVALTINQMPSHSHGNKVHTSSFNSYTAQNTYPSGRNYASSAYRQLRNTTSNHTNTNEIVAAGGNEAHENRPPFYVLAFIMKQ